MKWRVMVELGGVEGTVQLYEVSAGGSKTAEYSAETLGLSVTEGKAPLAGLQRRLVQAQVEERCRSRRRCDHCGAQRPLKDFRRRRLASLFGVGGFVPPVSAPAGVASRRPITPVAEIMPDPCPTVVRRSMNALSPKWAACRHTAAPVRCSMSSSRPARPGGETIRRRTLRVGARLERVAVRPPTSARGNETPSWYAYRDR